MPKRLLILPLFLALGALALFVSRTDAKPETIAQIAPGVWFREGDLKNLGHCNNIVIEMKNYLIVVDANFPSGARATMADVKRVSSKLVKYVFDTHHHGDHSYGNAVWTDAGATTLAYRGVAEEMLRYEPARWRQAEKERKDVADMHRPSVEPPKQTFAGNQFVLDDGARKVEFHFFGWAHTRGDGFVYLPKERILCTGDAVANGPYNYTADGNIANWPEVIRAAQKLKVKTVLPGHGVPGGPELLEGQALFMVELRKAVKSAVDQGGKPADLAKLQLPDSVRNWVGDGLPQQAKDAYEEITQGKPHGEILGGK
ncbi:MAG TPA: MBL fold metallo-hydrolase [Bryobacteraceae bacterium]|jgi:glyoxylase-like metal-dependent hydrolase (beta-lactamase superfamily II)|nr:MBL fold metallo-hydrolase [Bryobacteraceae bacterium]